MPVNTFGKILISSAVATVTCAALSGCGQNAHITAPTPSPTLRRTYAGDDVSNGEYSIAISATNDTGGAFRGDEKAFITLDSPDGKVIYFAGEFKLGMDLRLADPVQTDPRSTQSWTSVRAAIVSGLLAPSDRIVFDKRKWAIDSGLDTHYYRLFDSNHLLVPLANRHAPTALRFSLVIKNEFGLGHSAEVTMPIRYRYAFDDEAMGPARFDKDGGVSYTPDPHITSRVIAGLEWVSNAAITSPDPACNSSFHINYPVDFVDMTGAHHNFAATATGLRSNSGEWSNVSVNRASILGAIGSALGGSVATFTTPSDYEGLCYRKIYGFVLTDRFIDLDLSGVRLNVTAGPLKGDAIYGLTKAEAF